MSGRSKLELGFAAAFTLACSGGGEPTLFAGGAGVESPNGMQPGSLAGSSAGNQGGTAGAAGGGGSLSAPSGPRGGAVPGPDDESAWVFDESALRTYTLTLDPAVWDNLQATAQDEVYAPAELQVDGEQLPQVGLRFKGAVGTLEACFDDTGALVCSKLSMKIKFDEYDPEQRLHGLKRLNFNSMRTDRSEMHERLAYRLFREMGVPAPRANHARLIVNGEYRGVFSLVEEIDGRFTSSRFAPGNGNLYKAQWPNTDNLATLTEHLETNEDQPEHSAMIAFYGALRDASPEDLAQVLERFTDVNQLFAFVAVDRAINNWDGMTGFYCFGDSCNNDNYYFYQHDAEPRFTLLPWDLDNTFTVPSPFEAVPSALAIPADCSARYSVFSGVSVQAPACDPLIGGVARSDPARVRAEMTRFLDGAFTLERMHGWLDAWQAQIDPAVAEDTHGPRLDAFRAAVNRLRGDLGLLRLRSIAERDEQPVGRFALTPNALEGFESTTELELGLGVLRSSTPETTVAVALEQAGALAGAHDARLSFEFRDGLVPWSQWAELRMPFAGVADLSRSSSLRLVVRSDRPRMLRISVDSPAYTDRDLSGTVSWDVQLNGSPQELELSLSDTGFSGGGTLVPERLNDVLASATALLFEPFAEGRGEEGYLGAGMSDSGSIQVDEIQFTP